MLTLKFPANFVSTIHLPAAGLANEASNDATAHVQAAEAQLRQAQAFYRARRYQDAINAYKAVQSLIYTLINPGHRTAAHLLDDALMLPVGKDIELAVAEASLKLAEAIHPVMTAPRPPVSVSGVRIPDELAMLSQIGFTSDAAVPLDLREAATVGLEHLAQGRISQAVEVLSGALDRVGQPQTSEENANAGTIALDLSAARLSAGDAQEAGRLTEMAASFFEAAGDGLGRAQALHNQAVVFQRLGEADKAAAAAEKADQAFREVATSWGATITTGPPPEPPGEPSEPAPLPPAGGGHIPISGGPMVSHLPHGGGTMITLPNRGGTIVSAHLANVFSEAAAAGAVGSGGRFNLPAAAVANLPTASSVFSGAVVSMPAVPPTINPSVDLADLAFIPAKDPSVVAVRWPGAGEGWAGVALPNPAETEQQTRTWALNLATDKQLVSIQWKDGVRPEAPALLDSVYKARIETKSLRDLVFRPRDVGETTAYLTHLYAFVIPQALGDCYQQIGNFERAEAYYLQAAEYSFINTELEAPALWIKLANNLLLWGDHLYRQEQLEDAKQVYGRLITDGGKAPTGSPLYDLGVFAGPVADAKKILAALDDPGSTGVNPALALPLVTVWARWQYLLAGLDYYGTSFMPIFTFEYLQQVARAFAQQAAHAEQEYVNFQVHAEAETASRRDLQGAVTLSQAEAAGRDEQLRAAQSDGNAMEDAVHLAELRAADAAADRVRYEVLGYDQVKFQSVAAAHSAHEDWHGNEIRQLARDMEAGSWEGNYGKLAAAATYLAGMKSYEYQLARLDDVAAEMQATIPIAQQQLEAAKHREIAAALAAEAAHLRTSLTEDALAAFENEVFTPELWTRMAEAMRELSRSYVEWAISGAKLMERAYNFETDSELKVIKSDYPGSETGGLLGAEYLQRDVDSFTYHYVAHTRTKETNVKDVLSLANEYPMPFGEFLQSGKMTFETVLRDADLRHPGLYGQRVQSVEIEMIGLMPPEGVKGTLRGGGVSRYRTADGGERTRVHTTDTMALSEFTVRGDAFVYRMDPRMHGLFEGQGVATTWELELPRRSNDLDYRLITDVRLVIYYNARFDQALKDSVLTRPAVDGELVHVRDLLLRYDFPEAWYGFLDTGQMNFDLTERYLPRNETNFHTDKVSLRLLLAEGVPPQDVSVTLKLPGKAAVTADTDANGGIGTAPGNDLEGKMGGALPGTWELSVKPKVGSPLLDEDGKLKGDLIEQVAIISQYRFDWPD